MDLTKMIECGKRIYNSKMIEEKDETGKVKYSDDEAIRALCSKVFDNNNRVKNLEDLRSFNALLVEVAEEVAQPRIQPILDAVANYSTVGINDTKVYEVNKKARVHTKLSATASGVDFKRLPAGLKKTPAIPEKHQFGAYYNIDRMVSDPVNEFRNAVNLIADYKVKYIFGKIMFLARNGATAGKIPTNQSLDVANISLTQFRALENKLIRYGKVSPVLIADVNLIDSLAQKQTTLSVANDLTTDDLKTELLRELNITKISRSTAISADNPFTDDMNSKVDLPVNEGIMLAGGTKSPFYITEFGSMRTMEGLPDIEDERVNMKIDFKIDITLLVGQAMAYIKDQSVSL